MIVQSVPTILKQRNQVNRECLYAWYPEVVLETNAISEPRDIYIHKGIDKDLLRESSSINRCKLIVFYFVIFKTNKNKNEFSIVYICFSFE